MAAFRHRSNESDEWNPNVIPLIGHHSTSVPAITKDLQMQNNDSNNNSADDAVVCENGVCTLQWKPKKPQRPAA